jgi:hypothetical protein
MSTHLAEMLLELKLHGPVDRLRKTRPFSDDIKATQAILFDPDVPKLKKLKAYRSWLQNFQPCVFGRIAAKNENIFICLLDEHDILRMKDGDPDVHDTIQDARQCWKRLALDGRHSSFLILLLSPSLVTREPGDRLKEVCRRLMELYMEIPSVHDDTIHTQREYVFLRGIHGDARKIVKFSTLPNVFCAQGDGRWWHDHRTPGGVMITSNALGHFAHARASTRSISGAEKVAALENAMRTINNAFRPGRKNSGLKHCPITWLHTRGPDEEMIVRPTTELSGFSPNRYSGFFHTDHLIPSVFFHAERDRKEIPTYDDLDLRYIHDGSTDTQAHVELMAGESCGWYEVQQGLNRLPDFVNPEKTKDLSEKERGRLARWAEDRLKGRLA